MNQVTDLIPHRPPFLFVDEIVSETPKSLVARRAWRPEEAFYRGHYPGAPVTPGVLLCESALQTGALFLARHHTGLGLADGLPMVAKLGDVRFRRPVLPGETTTTEVRLEEVVSGFFRMSATMKSGAERVMTAEFFAVWRPLEDRGSKPPAP